jgi:GNAT superfamily N-acetyltransferase
MLGVTAMPTGAAPLVTRMAGQEFDELPGVVGHEDTVQAVADVWAAGHPVRTRLEMRMGIYALQTLVPPARPAPGRILPAKLHSAPLVGWMEGFEEDTGIFSTGPAETVRNLLASDALFVWEDDGEPVAMAGFSGTTPNGVRVGYVYTPPEHRGRGYATGLTAALCRLALDRGSRFCFLYADLNDPVSTGIYRRLGFAQVATARAVRFDPV